MEKMRLCWRWSVLGDQGQRAAWLDSCGSEAAMSYEVGCASEEQEDWKALGAQTREAPCPGAHAGQSLLLAMIAAGGAQAVVWIDASSGPENLTSFVVELCRSMSIPLAVEPAGAAAMLWGLARMSEAVARPLEDGSRPNEHRFEFESDDASKDDPQPAPQGRPVQGLAPDEIDEPRWLDDVDWLNDADAEDRATDSPRPEPLGVFPAVCEFTPPPPIPPFEDASADAKAKIAKPRPRRLIPRHSGKGRRAHIPKRRPGSTGGFHG